MSSAVLGNYTASVRCADVKKDFQARSLLGTVSNEQEEAHLSEVVGNCVL